MKPLSLAKLVLLSAAMGGTLPRYPGVDFNLRRREKTKEESDADWKRVLETEQEAIRKAQEKRERKARRKQK